MQPVLDVGRLRLLREVSVRGTIAGAARALGLTASAVSQQLAVLEREAGVALFDRSSRGVVLTGPGRMLAERADEVLDVLGRARADLDELAGSISGVVRVATVASAALGIVSAAAAALAAEHPGIALHVATAEPARSVEQVLAGDADLALIDEYEYQPIALADTLHPRRLRVEPLVAVLADDGEQADAFRDGHRVRLTDLREHDWVMPPDDAACGLAVRSACRAAGFEPRVRWESDDMMVLSRAVAGGHGLAVLPLLSVDTTVPGICVRELAEPALRRTLSVVGRAVNLRRPVVSTVADALAVAAAPA